jgi:hypothetical protein
VDTLSLLEAAPLKGWLLPVVQVLLLKYMEVRASTLGDIAEVPELCKATQASSRLDSYPL